MSEKIDEEWNPENDFVEESQPENAEFVLEKTRAYYKEPGNSCGGNLHIVLDDGNIDADCVLFCLNRCEGNSDKTGIDICNLLLQMNEEERQYIYMHTIRN